MGGSGPFPLPPPAATSHPPPCPCRAYFCRLVAVRLVWSPSPSLSPFPPIPARTIAPDTPLVPPTGVRLRSSLPVAPLILPLPVLYLPSPLPCLRARRLVPDRMAWLVFPALPILPSFSLLSPHLFRWFSCFLLVFCASVWFCRLCMAPGLVLGPSAPAAAPTPDPHLLPIPPAHPPFSHFVVFSPSSFPPFARLPCGWPLCPPCLSFRLFPRRLPVGRAWGGV